MNKLEQKIDELTSEMKNKEQRLENLKEKRTRLLDLLVDRYVEKTLDKEKIPAKTFESFAEYANMFSEHARLVLAYYAEKEGMIDSSRGKMFTEGYLNRVPGARICDLGLDDHTHWYESYSAFGYSIGGISAFEVEKAICRLYGHNTFKIDDKIAQMPKDIENLERHIKVLEFEKEIFEETKDEYIPSKDVNVSKDYKEKIEWHTQEILKELADKNPRVVETNVGYRNAYVAIETEDGTINISIIYKNKGRRSIFETKRFKDIPIASLPYKDSATNLFRELNIALVTGYNPWN